VLRSAIRGVVPGRRASTSVDPAGDRRPLVDREERRLERGVVADAVEEAGDGPGPVRSGPVVRGGPAAERGQQALRRDDTLGGEDVVRGTAPPRTRSRTVPKPRT
jgi:hypothetical protein